MYSWMYSAAHAPKSSSPSRNAISARFDVDVYQYVPVVIRYAFVTSSV